MKLKSLIGFLPSWRNALLALLSAVLLILAFPDFEIWFLAWFALVPLMWAVERQKHCVTACFILGWLFGNVFFFGTCWWLAFAPITYAGFPPVLAYSLLFCVTSVAAVFPGIFGAVLAVLLRRFGSKAFLAAPFVWVFTEFLRYWLTGNNWNAIGYAAAFGGARSVRPAAFGGVYLVGFLFVAATSFLVWLFATRNSPSRARQAIITTMVLSSAILFFFNIGSRYFDNAAEPALEEGNGNTEAEVIALQPNVPMSGLTLEKWQQLRRSHVQLAESALAEIRANPHSALRTPQSTVVIFPESPMNFMYEDDPETKEFINGFAAKNNVSVLFNSAEPDRSNGKFFNSAVMVGPEGREVAQYDKIYLLPFGEAVPVPFESFVPAFVGSFSYGKEYDLFHLGGAKAGVMICFESHFGQLSREYVRNGADVLIEMTNDGYLGPTPVLRQHMANAVFRAVETNRPVLRVTNVGITAYINERGQVLDEAEPYTEATRVWSVAKSDGSQTFYVKYGDWFAWLCSVVTITLLGLALWRRE